jgi:hypothetical protein
MNGSKTATAIWKTQYFLTVDSLYGNTTGEDWYDSGLNAYAHLDNVTESGSSGIRYMFTEWNGDASGGSYASSDAITMNAPKIAIANWKTQYYIIVESSYGNTTGEGWYDSGSIAYAGLDNVTESGSSGIRYMFTEWSGDALGGDYTSSSAIMMNGSKTAIAIWKIQYYLTIDSPYGNTTGEGWYDRGLNTYAHLDNGTVSGGSGIQYVFTQWSGDALGGDFVSSSAIIMNASKTAIANWKTQYYLAVDSPYGNTTGGEWYDSGLSAYAGLDIGKESGDQGIRFMFTQWSGDASGTNFSTSSAINMNGSKIATAKWIIQFQLSILSNPINNVNIYIDGSSIPTGITQYETWFDSDSSHMIKAEPITLHLVDNYTFSKWILSASTTLDNPIFIIIEDAMTLIANYSVVDEDNEPPSSSITVPSPDSFQTSLVFTVSWYGSDNHGGSGLKGYDIQYRDGLNGVWADWLTNITWTSSNFTGVNGHTYYFRSRAQDNQGNWENYPTGDGDTYTEINLYINFGQISGYVFVMGTSTIIQDVTISTDTGGYSAVTNTSGGYLLIVEEGTYTITASKSGYISVERVLSIIPGELKSQNFYLSLSLDTDNDGLPDNWEMLHFGNLDQGPNDDPDDDGFTNLYESNHDTNPTEPGTSGSQGESKADSSWFTILLAIVIICILIIFFIWKRKGKEDDSKSSEDPGVRKEDDYREDDNDDNQYQQEESDITQGLDENIEYEAGITDFDDEISEILSTSSITHR